MMLKQILKQVWNRRRANGWLFVELLLVFCLVWYMVDYFFVYEYNKTLPSCRDVRHTYQVDMALLPTEHPEYQPGQSDSTALEANYDRVLDRIRAYPEVEALAVLNQMSTPGGGSYMGQSFRSHTDTLCMASGQCIQFDPRTDYFRVFGYTTPDGKPVSTADFDWSEPRAVVIGQITQSLLSPDKSAVGMVLENAYSTDYTYVVKGVVGNVKRFDYERPQNTFYQALRVRADNIKDLEIAIRSSASRSDAQFLSDFKARMSKELRIGNFYLKGMQPYSQIHADANMGRTNENRVLIIMMLFFLVNIMLCVMGTFWYRIRVRREEIGLRMAMGSTRSGIRRMLFQEGLCLLALVAVPTMLLEMQIVYAGGVQTLGRESFHVGYLPDRTVLRFFITNGLTYLLLAVTIVAAIWFPAGRAAKMAPADALHYE